MSGDAPKKRRGPAPTGTTPMRPDQQATALRMRAAGCGYEEIGKLLHVGKNRVRAFLIGDGAGDLPPKLRKSDDPQYDDDIYEQYTAGVPFPAMSEDIGLTVNTIRDRIVAMRRDGRITIFRRPQVATGAGGRVEMASERPRIIGDETAFAKLRFRDDPRSKRRAVRHTPHGTAVSVIHSSAAWGAI